MQKAVKLYNKKMGLCKMQNPIFCSSIWCSAIKLTVINCWQSIKPLIAFSSVCTKIFQNSVHLDLWLQFLSSKKFDVVRVLLWFTDRLYVRQLLTISGTMYLYFFVLLLRTSKHFVFRIKKEFCFSWHSQH